MPPKSRRLPRGRALLFALAVTAGLSAAREGRADPTKAQCVEADTNAQIERRAQHFHAARELLQLCSQPACPKLVHDDCGQRLNDLDAVNPTVVFAAKDARGDDVVAVHVLMDGIAIADELAGAPIPVDSGPHTFTFRTDGAPDVQRKLVLHEGEKDRQERVIFPDLHRAAAAAPPKVASDASSASGSTWNGQKTAAVLAGSAGLVGLIVGGVTGALSFSAWSSSKSECGPSSCDDRAKALSDHDSAVTDSTISDVGFIAGGVLAAGGLVLYLTAPSSSSSGSRGSGALRVVPSVGREGAGMRLEGRF